MQQLDNPMHTGYGFNDWLRRADPVAFECDECGEAIYVGERFLCFGTSRICQCCIDYAWEYAESDEK